MDLPFPQYGSFQIAKLVEAEQRVVALAFKVAVVGRSFLLPMRWADRTVHVENDLVDRRAAVDLFWGTRGEEIGSTSQALPQEENRRTARVFVVIGTFTLISLGVVAYLPQPLLVAIYLGIAILGVTWPWLMIGVAILGDRLTRSQAVTSPGDESPAA